VTSSNPLDQIPRGTTIPEAPRLADELRKMEYEPLLPIEKKLILWSVGLGVVALGLLVWLSYSFFPTGH
jgi:hypothetical protein